LFVFQAKIPTGRNDVAPEERSEDILLFAYVDGELDEDQRRLVEELLAHDPDVRQRVELMRELNRLLKAAYQEDSDETA
jgi:anti-sigma factor RsiW